MRAVLVACASCLAAGLCLGPGVAGALASRGVLLSSSEKAQSVRISAAQLDAAADTGPTSYTVRSRAGSAGTTIRLRRGLSIRGLLTLAGFDPGAVESISVASPSGRLVSLFAADFADPSPFAQGPALVVAEPGGTRYLRPVRNSRDTNAGESFQVSTGLDITVDGGALLAVRAGANPRRTATGRTVSFSAGVRPAPPGATLTYRWDFGDGTQGAGARTTHRYTQEGSFKARVIANGRGGSTQACPDSCGDSATVSVRVGRTRTSPRPATTQGSSGANPGAPGGGGSGTGSGGSGNGAGGATGAAARRPARPRAEPLPRADPDATITGILLADSGIARASSLPTLRSSGSAGAGAGAGDSGSPGGGKLGGSIALTLALIALGALHERRGGRLGAA